MYDNIGKKLKGFAKTIFAICLIASVIGGIAIMAIDGDLAIIGIIVMAVGILVSWISTWFLYGFGEIVDKVCDIEKNTRNGGFVKTSSAASDIKSQVQAQIDNERIQKLENLRAEGLITEEEFQEAVNNS